MSNKFKVGDKVKWITELKAEEGTVELKSSGVIKSVKMSTFGSKRKGMGATIKVTSKNYKEAYGKDWAFVSFSKLEKV